MELFVSDEKNIFEPKSVTFEERLKQLADNEKQDEENAKREKHSPFSHWTQFNNEHTREMIWLALKYPKAHGILLFLMDQMDEYNAVMCSYKVIEECVGVGHVTIARSLKVLSDKGFIAILKSGTSNVYAINDKVYWKSWGNRRKYSKFPANVVLSLSEQDKEYQVAFEDLEFTKHKEVHKNLDYNDTKFNQRGENWQ